MATGRTTVREMGSAHGQAAKEDMSEWGQELKQATRGEALPGEARVRDLPPMAGDTVQDRVRETPTKAGTQKPEKTSRR